MKEIVILVVFVVGLAAIIQYEGIKDDDAELLEAAFINEIAEPATILFTLEDSMDRKDIIERIGDLLDYDEDKKKQLHTTYRSMQWDAFNDVLVPYLVEEYELTELEREVLLTHSSVYLDQENDVLEGLYLSHNYAIDRESTVVDISNALIEPVLENKEKLVPQLVRPEEVAALLEYVGDETELLPDLVPLPPQDIGVKVENGKILLTFTTIYYNNGIGPLELIADPKTIGTRGDFDREVFQRIYRDNGTYRDKSAGLFEWHNEHLHYHFIDFIEYKLIGIDAKNVVITDELAEKTTFCVRDISRVELPGRDVDEEATYRICGRERQGVSVGWGDAYFNTYADQNLDITDLPSGRYKLSFLANPTNRFDELSLENNEASAVIMYDKEEMSVEIISHKPTELPIFEHIHVEQTF